MILVTGGAGYVGSHAAAGIAHRGEGVVIADNLSTGHKKAALRNKLYVGDIRDGAFLDKIFTENKIDAVMHFASDSLVGVSMREPLSYYNNNLSGAQSLLGAMVRHNVEHIVFSSSAAVYGEPDSVPILETDKTEPTNPYGETKLAIEKLLFWCAMAYGIKYVSLRYFNVAGAWNEYGIGEDHSPETHLIPLVLKTALGQRDNIVIFGTDYDTPDGTCIRDYIDVRDLADAHILAIDYLRRGNKSGAFNLGNGQGFSVKEIIDISKKISKTDFDVKIGPRREGDPAILIASREKAKNELLWKPKHESIENVIGSAWRWHSTRPEGF